MSKLKPYFEMLKLALIVLFHPGDAFYLIKRNRGKNYIVPSVIILLAFVITQAVGVFLLNYTISGVNVREANAFGNSFLMTCILISWAIAAYAISAIMSGSTFFAESLYGTVLAVMPMVVLQIPISMSTWVMGSSEKVFYDFFLMFVEAWVILLVFRGVMVLNEYSFGKTVIVCLLSLLFIVIFWAVLLMLFIFTSNLITFISGFITEISNR